MNKEASGLEVILITINSATSSAEGALAFYFGMNAKNFYSDPKIVSELKCIAEELKKELGKQIRWWEPGIRKLKNRIDEALSPKILMQEAAGRWLLSKKDEYSSFVADYLKHKNGGTAEEYNRLQKAEENVCNLLKRRYNVIRRLEDIMKERGKIVGTKGIYDALKAEFPDRNSYIRHFDDFLKAHVEFHRQWGDARDVQKLYSKIVELATCKEMALAEYDADFIYCSGNLEPEKTPYPNPFEPLPGIMLS
jgi:hypothetical protein